MSKRPAWLGAAASLLAVFSLNPVSVQAQDDSPASLVQQCSRFSDGRPAIAITFCDRALRYADRLSDADLGLAFVGRAFARMRLKEFDKSIEDFKSAQRVLPSDYSIWAALGNAYYRKKDYANAIKAFDESIKYYNERDGANYLYARGLAKLNGGDPVGGRADMAVARERNPMAAEYSMDD